MTDNFSGNPFGYPDGPTGPQGGRAQNRPLDGLYGYRPQTALAGTVKRWAVLSCPSVHHFVSSITFQPTDRWPLYVACVWVATHTIACRYWN